MDKLEMLRLAAVRLDEASDALWFAEQSLLQSKRQVERAKADHAKALDEAVKPASPGGCSDTAASRCSNMST